MLYKYIQIMAATSASATKSQKSIKQTIENAINRHDR